MKVTMRYFAVVMVILLGLSPQDSALADTFRFKEHYTEAYFYTIDDSGCIHTEVMLFTGQDILYGLSIYQWNVCSQQVLQDVFAPSTPLSKEELKYFGNLDSVRLNTTVQASDTLSGFSVDVAIDLTWTGLDEIYIYHNHSHDGDWPGCRVNMQDRSRSRIARSTGSVSIGMTNFAPEPSTAASIFLLHNVEISHGCD